jgi:phage FluMu gp28-like protein
MPWETVYIGLDFGRRRDATLARAFRHKDRSEVALLRLYQAPFPEQLRQIDAFYRRWPCNVVMVADENGMGMQMAETFGTVYGKGFVKRGWTQQAKEQDITAARMLCDEASWRALKLDWVKAEWEAYQVVQQDSNGKWVQPKYGAPPGLHDDTVTAGCLVAPHLMRGYVDRAPAEPIKPFTGAWMEQELDRLSGGGPIRRIT